MELLFRIPAGSTRKGLNKYLVRLKAKIAPSTTKVFDKVNSIQFITFNLS